MEGEKDRVREQDRRKEAKERRLTLCEISPGQNRNWRPEGQSEAACLSLLQRQCPTQARTTSKPLLSLQRVLLVPQSNQSAEQGEGWEV